MDAGTRQILKGEERSRQQALLWLCGRVDVDMTFLGTVMRQYSRRGRVLVLDALRDFALWLRSYRRRHMAVSEHTVRVWARERSRYRPLPALRAATRKQDVVLAFLRLAMDQAVRGGHGGRVSRVPEGGSARGAQKARAMLRAMGGGNRDGDGLTPAERTAASLAMMRELLSDIEEEDRAFAEVLLETLPAGQGRE